VAFNNIFDKKKVLVTGHTGFKGSWLCTWLNELGASVTGVSNEIIGEPSNYSVSKIADLIDSRFIDIKNFDLFKNVVEEVQPDFIFHLAAQALVRPSYEEPLETILTNAIGTTNLLEILRELNPEVTAIFITSDKVYDNVEWIWGYREIDKIGGSDPYSASKGMAELAIKSYFNSFFKSDEFNVRIAVSRAGNVIGGGDWARDRIVPDCFRSWSQNEVVEIRNPNSTRPWQHVLEPLSGYLSLAENLYNDKKFHGEVYNFGPAAEQNYSVKELIAVMEKTWGRTKWKDVSNNNHFHEAGLLKLNCDKALSELHWRPVLCFNETVTMTVEWYKEFYENKVNNMSLFSVEQINSYTRLANSRGLSWSND